MQVDIDLACWHTGTKAQTLEFLKDCDRQSEDISDLMSQIEDEDKVSDWQVTILECRICSKRQVVVLPVGGPLEDAECSTCGCMTADVIEKEQEII